MYLLLVNRSVFSLTFSRLPVNSFKAIVTRVEQVISICIQVTSEKVLVYILKMNYSSCFTKLEYRKDKDTFKR